MGAYGGSVLICLAFAFLAMLVPINKKVTLLGEVERVSRNIGSGNRGIGGSPHQNGLPYENGKPNESPTYPDDGCQQITTVERVERICLCLFFFALCMWLLYYEAWRSFSAGRNLRTALAILLFFPSFLLCIEFADAASAFGIRGWTSIGQNFLCAYTEHYCYDKGCGKAQDSHEAAVALHFAYYNFVKRHNALRATPAMAAGVERDFWTVGRLLEAAVHV